MARSLSCREAWEAAATVAMGTSQEEWEVVMACRWANRS